MERLRWSPHLAGPARNPALPRQLADALAAAADDAVGDCLAQRADLTDEQIRTLAARGNGIAVRLAHRGLLPAGAVDGRDVHVVLALFEACGAPPRWAREHASSPDPRIRARLAAANPALPQDVMWTLARVPRPPSLA